MKTTLSSLLDKLHTCSSHDVSVTPELFVKAWDELRRHDITPQDKPTHSVMAALLLEHNRFKSLLTKPEQDQLVSLIKLAVERYMEKTNPPNKLGKLIIGRIKES